MDAYYCQRRGCYVVENPDYIHISGCVDNKMHEFLFPVWGIIPSGEWARMEEHFASCGFTTTCRATGKKLGYLGGRYVDNGKLIPGADKFHEVEAPQWVIEQRHIRND